MTVSPVTTASKPDVYIIAAPSGTGKTTLNRRLIEENTAVRISVSHTTRPCRVGETNGDHYWFVDQQTFESLIAQKAMLEWARVHDAYYGTSLKEIARIRDQGFITILEIDVQGWEQVSKQLSSATAIFIAPPSMKTLWELLRARKTDTENQAWKRFQNARAEIASCSLFHHFIINDSLDQAYQELKQIVIEGKSPLLSREQGVTHCMKLVQEFDSAPWICDIRSQYKW